MAAQKQLLFLVICIWGACCLASSVKSSVPKPAMVIEEQKRSAALTQALFDLTDLPPELISIVDQYDKSLTGRRFALVGYGVKDLQVLADGRIAVAGAPDGSIVLLKSDGTYSATLSGHSSPVKVLAPLYSRFLASASRDETIKIWDLTTGKCVRTLRTSNGTAQALIRLPRGRIAAGFLSQTIIVWDIASGNLEKQFIYQQHDYTHGFGSDKEHRVLALAWLPEKNRLVSAGDGNHIKVWDLNDTASVIRKEIGDMYATKFGQTVFEEIGALLTLPDERILSGWGDGKIRLFDPESGKYVLTLEGHKGYVTTLLLLTPTIVVSGDDAGVIKVWDLSKKKDQCIKSFEGHTQLINALVKIDAKTFLSGSGDGAIRKWTLE